jgi:hypothetical protein
MNEKMTPEEFTQTYLSDTFDLRELYNAQISPLVRQIYDLSREHKLPFFASFCVNNEGGECGLLFTSNLVGPERTPVDLVVAHRISHLPPEAVFRILDFINYVESALGVAGQQQDRTLN